MKKTSRPPETAVPVLKLYYQRAKTQLAARDGRSSTKVVLPENENVVKRHPNFFNYIGPNPCKAMGHIEKRHSL